MGTIVEGITKDGTVIVMIETNYENRYSVVNEVMRMPRVVTVHTISKDNHIDFTHLSLDFFYKV